MHCKRNPRLDAERTEKTNLFTICFLRRGPIFTKNLTCYLRFARFASHRWRVLRRSSKFDIYYTLKLAYFGSRFRAGRECFFDLSDR